ncbi:MAG: universal stress protein [Gemmatimonadota bacterium]
MKKILLPLDGSPLADQAIPHAAALARAFNAEILCLRVVGGGEAEGSLEWRLERAEAASYLADVAAVLSGAGCRASVELSVGRASEQILHCARAAGADVIALTSHGRGGMTDFSLSGTAFKVLSRAPCSIMVVPSKEGATVARRPAIYESVLVGLGQTPRSDWAARLAATIARTHDAELILAHALPVAATIDGGDIPETSAQDLQRSTASAAKRHLKSLTGELKDGSLRMATVVLTGPDPARAIRRAASAAGASLIVTAVGAPQEGGRPSYGEVSNALLGGTDVPILVLHDSTIEPRYRLAPQSNRWSRKALPAAP